MFDTRYDRSARHLARVDPQGFLRWALPTTAVMFHRWLDARLRPSPEEPESFCDLVAEVEHSAEPWVLWALSVEFMLQPRSELFNRLLIYLGQLREEQLPPGARGDRYQVGAIVVNLTGVGRTSREMSLGDTNIVTSLQVEERNLSAEDAAATLEAIAGGTTTPVLLPFIPLMKGGDETGIIQRWMEVASAEPDARRRGTYGAFALIFAEAADRQQVWKDALQGWNMIESQQVLEWMAQAEVKRAAKAVIQVLQRRFGAVSTEVEAAIRASSDLAQLEAWLDLAVTATSLDDFRQVSQL